MQTTMQTVTKEVYVLPDGTEFSDYKEAMAYQANLENEVMIDDFLDSLEDKTKQAKSRMRNDIVKFLGFQAEQNAAEETVEDEPVEAAAA